MIKYQKYIKIELSSGANRPGQFSFWKPNLLSIERAEGFKPDVLRSISFIIRTNKDFSTSNIS